MPLRYLLDTNILSDLILNPQGTVAQRISSAGENAACTSIVVVAELRFGAEKSGSSKLAGRIDLILSALDILPLEAPAVTTERSAGSWRARVHPLAPMIY